MAIDKITYGKTLGAKAWDKVTPQKINEIIDTVNDITDGTYTIDDLTVETLTATTSVSTNTIAEKDSATGVTVDGVLLKDGGVKTVKGNVTQLSSLTTTVVANAPSGVITTVTATTAAVTAATFAFTNSFITASSVLQVSFKYNGTLVTNGVPIVYIGTPGSGTVNITILNADATNALNGTLEIHYLVV